jgi:hypothetical protein
MRWWERVMGTLGWYRWATKERFWTVKEDCRAGERSFYLDKPRDTLRMVWRRVKP